MDESKQKLKEIMSGWKNLLFPNPQTEKIHKNRASVCSKCEHNIKNICKKCGCPLAAKTRSEISTCPLKKWPL
jgi:hypothetical protein